MMEELTPGCATVMAVHMRRRERNGRTAGIRYLDCLLCMLKTSMNDTVVKRGSWISMAGFFAVQIDTSKFDSISGFIHSYLLFFSFFAVTAIVGYRFFTKKEKAEQGRIAAQCGAVCSECSYFVEGLCASCPEGDPEVRGTCKIFVCAGELGNTCNVCPDLLRCKTFRQERDNCPFEREFFPLHTGMGYIIYEKNPEKSIQLFKNYVNRGEFGLLVSRRFPDQVKARYNLKNAADIWLTTAEGEDNWIDPNNLSKLHHVITDFVRNAPVSIILFEGLEYLMVRNSFLNSLKFVQSLMDEIVLNRPRLLLSINPEAFEKKELALLRRELIELHD